jgi:hypothetical protein
MALPKGPKPVPVGATARCGEIVMAALTSGAIGLAVYVVALKVLSPWSAFRLRSDSLVEMGVAVGAGILMAGGLFWRHVARPELEAGGLFGGAIGDVNDLYDDDAPNFPSVDD